MSRGQLEKLVAKNAKSGQYDLQRSWCQALHCRNALQPQVGKPNTTTCKSIKWTSGYSHVQGCTWTHGHHGMYRRVQTCAGMDEGSRGRVHRNVWLDDGVASRANEHLLHLCFGPPFALPAIAPPTLNHLAQVVEVPPQNKKPRRAAPAPTAGAEELAPSLTEKSRRQADHKACCSGPRTPIATIFASNP